MFPCGFALGKRRTDGLATGSLILRDLLNISGTASSPSIAAEGDEEGLGSGCGLIGGEDGRLYGS
ncbi:beta-fructosidase, levanase/invertase [Anopheles sinensis]|uniref:Beta-fructosidase, levanase/invertase n=1 Tax=Anopheles sinensis TaxID=74873 RepID=A0A084WGC6_ANOSI|nr:beta-fructosidase, levanase/invertase [Anopheles sinensis]